ncbi:hypothetical protein J3Q64DRAFT_1739692 [Phycomyces blakesleeanus]|uniref:Uncharacterized protein n=1 Tax=Phycomyces blakesleeanus TaxID=4837 RepID=A0ABR3AZS7_PHYBL
MLCMYVYIGCNDNKLDSLFLFCYHDYHLLIICVHVYMCMCICRLEMPQIITIQKKTYLLLIIKTIILLIYLIILKYKQIDKKKHFILTLSVLERLCICVFVYNYLLDLTGCLIA